MVDLLSGGWLMQTNFFYDLGLIRQWEGVNIDEKMEKNLTSTVSNQICDFSEFKFILPNKF